MVNKQRMDAAANFMQDQQLKQRLAHNQDIKRQIDDIEYQKREQVRFQKEFDEMLKQKQLANQAKIEEERRNLALSQKRMYKDELDKQMMLKNNLRAYGNMSAAEKQINKDDLVAYKNYESTNYAMIPGINNQKHINNNRYQPNPNSEFRVGSPKMRLDQATKLKNNVDRFQQYGAVHLG